MKLLLTDVSNPLGRALEHELERETFSLVTSGPDALDWHSASAVAAYIQDIRPGLVINTLGWSDLPDVRERTLQQAAAAGLGRACRPAGTPVLQFSSYRVFGGDNKSSHSERDEPNPQSDTGRAWLAAEQALEASLQQRLILRLSWLLDSHGDNLLTRLLTQLYSSEAVMVNTRLRGAPTALSDVARVAVALVKQVSCGAENWGTLHYCSTGACSQAELAAQVVEVLRQLEALPAEPMLTRLDSLPEDEPVSAVLSCRRVRDNFGVQTRSWEPSLVPMIKQWLHQNRN